jgi:DNA polymerase-3 subunit gamma/tau
VVKVEKNWDNLLRFIFDKYKTIGSNLEHGNIVDKISQTADSIKVEIGFNKEDKIFYDYLSGHEINVKLKKIIQEFFESDKKVHLSLVSVKDDADFKSKAQIKNLNDQEIENNKINDIKSNKYIQEAQNLFGSEIEKITLNK